MFDVVFLSGQQKGGCCPVEGPGFSVFSHPLSSRFPVAPIINLLASLKASEVWALVSHLVDTGAEWVHTDSELEAQTGGRVYL